MHVTCVPRGRAGCPPNAQHGEQASELARRDGSDRARGSACSVALALLRFASLPGCRPHAAARLPPCSGVQACLPPAPGEVGSQGGAMATKGPQDCASLEPCVWTGMWGALPALVRWGSRWGAGTPQTSPGHTPLPPQPPWDTGHQSQMARSKPVPGSVTGRPLSAAGGLLPSSRLQARPRGGRDGASCSAAGGWRVRPQVTVERMCTQCGACPGPKECREPCLRAVPSRTAPGSVTRASLLKRQRPLTGLAAARGA